MYLWENRILSGTLYWKPKIKNRSRNHFDIMLTKHIVDPGLNNVCACASLMAREGPLEDARAILVPRATILLTLRQGSRALGRVPFDQKFRFKISLNFSRLLLSLVSGDRRLKALADNAVQ